MSVMYSPTISIFLLAISLFWTPSQSSAASRHALVIGNSAYNSFALENPRADATAIASSLASLGYKLHRGQPQFDLDLDGLNDTIAEFMSTVENGSTTLIYYAGHGAASAGTNYLIPILPPRVRLRSESDIRDRSVSLQSILERLNTTNSEGVNVFLFDACRDAPVQSNSRSLNMTGLTPLNSARQPRGSFVGFSTEYGSIALDDNKSGHSPFASALLSALATNPGAEIELFYKRIMDQVYDSTSGQQFPIQESKIRGKHCIVECESITDQTQIQDFGTLAVSTTPLNAEVCFLIPGWTSQNCGTRMVLPMGRDVNLTVSAKGYKTITTKTRLTSTRQQLRVTLDKNSNTTLKIIGGVAAIIAAGALLSSGDKSTTAAEPGVTLTITPPRD